MRRLLAIIMLGGVFYGAWVVFTVTAPAGGEQKMTLFTIEKGEGVKEVSARLSKAGLIRSDWWFRTYVWAKNWEKSFKAGEHLISTEMNMTKVASVLTTNSAAPSERTLTFIEGWNNREIGDYLERQGIGTKKEFLRLVGKTAWQSRYAFLEDKPLEVDIEGYLFPDTYRVFNDATQEDIVKKMLDNFAQKLTPKMMEDIKKRGMTVHDTMTMASIIELEVRSDKERKMVADIFYKRLKNGIGLQSDASINYVTGKSDTSATIKDTQVDSPYNTYKYRGLPPGPISNPGLASIVAAIYPESNPYYYFLTTKEGKVLYARTFEEHKQNRAYLR